MAGSVDMTKPESRIDLAHEPDFTLGGGLTVRPSSRTVSCGGRETILEPRLMQVLIALARAEGSVVSRDDLIRCCWKGAVVGDDAISRAIFRLRRLAAESGAFQIETVPRVGYRLETSRPAAAEAPAPRRPRRKLALALALAAALAPALLGGWVLLRAGAAAECPSPTRVAVLPFDDYSSGGQGLYFGSRMADEIISSLSRERDLEVTGRSSVSMLGSRVTMSEARKKLRVSHLVEGSLVVQDQRIRAIVRILETKDGTQLWDRGFTRGLPEVFDLQKEVADGVVASLRRPEIRCARQM